jgi:hypothetical protein
MNNKYYIWKVNWELGNCHINLDKNMTLKKSFWSSGVLRGINKNGAVLSEKCSCLEFIVSKLQ